MYRLRTRIVNFRLTDEEFERVKSASAQQGARCLSDFARDIILRIASEAAPQAGDGLLSLERRLSTIELSLARVESALTGSSPSRVQSQS